MKVALLFLCTTSIWGRVHENARRLIFLIALKHYIVLLILGVKFRANYERPNIELVCSLHGSLKFLAFFRDRNRNPYVLVRSS